jgi:hypothetical protein
MFIKIKIARIYRKNIIIYMGVEEEQLGGAMRKYRAMKAKLAKAKLAKKVMPKKVAAKKAVPKHSKPPSRAAMSRPKPMYRGRLGMHLGGQQGIDGMGGMYNMLANSMQQQPAQVATTPAAQVATPDKVAQFTQQQMHQQQAVQGGRPHRRSRSPAKKATKAKKAVVGKAMKPRRKKMVKRGGSEEEQEQEEEMVEEFQSGGFQALESLVASLSGGGYGRKRVVRHRPVARRSPSPVARRRRPVARRT